MHLLRMERDEMLYMSSFRIVRIVRDSKTLYELS